MLFLLHSQIISNSGFAGLCVIGHGSALWHLLDVHVRRASLLGTGSIFVVGQIYELRWLFYAWFSSTISVRARPRTFLSFRHFVRSAVPAYINGDSLGKGVHEYA